MYIPTHVSETNFKRSKKENETIAFKFTSHNNTPDRDVAELQRDDKSNRFITVPTIKEREQLLRPIRVPIYKGIMGIRVLVIRKEDNEKFAKINEPKDLEAFKVGQGIGWVDTIILRKNNLNVSEGINSDALYNMLKAKRIDYFPRGIVELLDRQIWDLGLAADDHLLLYYPLPMYFFVNKKNTELAHRLEKGWDIVIKNGEFEKLFLSEPPVISAIDELKKHKRHVIRLKNADLPEETPLNHPEYWFDLSPYEQ